MRRGAARVSNTNNLYLFTSKWATTKEAGSHRLRFRFPRLQVRERRAEHSACDARQNPGRSRVPSPARLGHACDPGPCPPLSTCREGSQSRNPGNEAAERELQWWGGLAPGQSAGHPPGPPPRPQGPGTGQGQSSSPARGSSRRRLTLSQETGQNIRWGLGLPSRPTSNALRGPEVPCRVTSPNPLVRYKCHWAVILRPWPLGA